MSDRGDRLWCEHSLRGCRERRRLPLTCVTVVTVDWSFSSVPCADAAASCPLTAWTAACATLPSPCSPNSAELTLAAVRRSRQMSTGCRLLWMGGA